MRIFRIFITIFILVHGISFSYGQNQDSFGEDPFSHIPSELRNKLVQQLNLLIKYQVNNQWDNMYDLLSQDCNGRLTKKEFIKQNKKFESIVKKSAKFESFEITQVVEVAQSEGTMHIELAITGCATYIKYGVTEKVQARTKATMENGEWLFCRIDAVAETIGGSDKPCEK